MHTQPLAPRSPRTALAGAIAAGLCALLSPAQAFVVDTAANVTGLPPGLKVHYTASSMCGPRMTGSVTKEMIGATTPGFETIRDPVTGQVQLRSTAVTRYTAPAFSVQSPSGCDLGASVEHGLTVLGVRENGAPVVREALLGHSTSAGTFTRQIDLTPEVSRLPAASELPRNQSMTLVTTFKNAFGHANTVLPTLEFRRPSATVIQGLTLDLVTRVFIRRDGERCISAPAPQGLRCAPASRSGVLEHAGIRLSLNKDDTQFSATSRTGAQLELRLTLTSAFATGTYTLRALATDDDPFEYTVDGEARAITLLNWRPASKTVLVQ